MTTDINPDFIRYDEDSALYLIQFEDVSHITPVLVLYFYEYPQSQDIMDSLPFLKDVIHIDPECNARARNWIINP